MTVSEDPWAALEEPSTRAPRSTEARDSSERERTWQEPSLLPEPLPRDGWVFKWIRSAARGQDDKSNVDKRFREGWEPVRAEDHPEILKEWRSDQKSGLIESGGLLLCKMSQEMVDQRSKFYRDKTLAGLTSAEEHYMRDNSEVVKKIKENRSRIVFGRTAR